jgi:XRE family transcriptional regulator, aerobic/anaerobic benzoate catabolism transcriptional regulator
MGVREPAGKSSRMGESSVVQSDGAFLGRLGERVREARARRGMTRKILARDSGVSERYLAQLESGRGNVSVLLLRQIAQALNLPLDEVVRADDGQSVELTLILQLLKRLPATKLARVRAQLVREYGSAYGARENRIALVGLRGAGKSTLGAALGRSLGVPFVELDHEVEAEAGTSLHEIFLLHGQAGFRRYERRALERILEKNDRCVIATGGSIVSEPATYDLVLSACLAVWLKAAPEEHMARVAAQGDYRPMAGNREAMDDLRRILAGREPLYAQADVTVDTAGKTVEASLSELARAVMPRTHIHQESV